MTTLMPTNSESIVLSRVIAADEPNLPPEVAKAVLKWAFTEEDHARMEELSSKAGAGTLTKEEAELAEGYARIGSFLGLVKSKARRSLQATSKP